MPGPGFRLMTVNLFSRWVDAADFARAIDLYRPDVLVAQELAPEAAKVIASSFPVHVLSPDIAYSGWGMASQLPAVISEDRPGWGRGGHGRIEVGNEVVNLATVHILDPMHLPLRRTRARRVDQVDSLLEWGDQLPPNEAQVVAGDFNATPRWPVYRRLADRWDDLVVEAARTSGTRPPSTWGPPRGPRLLRIDHVLGTGVTASNVAVEPVRGSDHSALVIDLEPKTSNLRY